MTKRLTKDVKTPQTRCLEKKEAEEKKKMEEYQRKFDAFHEAFKIAKRQYLNTKNLQGFEEDLRIIAREYPDIASINLIYFNCAESLAAKQDDDAEIMIYKVMEQELKYYSIHEMDMYLRSAHYYFSRGDEEQGKEWLFKLCRKDALPDNYEEAMEWHQLKGLWYKYRHYLEGKLPPSKSFFDKAEPVAPENCTMQIDEIFAEKDDKLLLELFIHLYEMSGEGESMHCLNKWESIFFDVDNMLRSIGADGIAHFLSVHGRRFQQTKEGLQAVGAKKALQLMEILATYFPRGKVPKTYSRREFLIDEILDSDDAFASAENFYNDENIEGELADALYRFAIDNQKEFR